MNLAVVFAFQGLNRSEYEASKLCLDDGHGGA